MLRSHPAHSRISNRPARHPLYAVLTIHTYVDIEEALQLGIEEYSRLASTYDGHAAPYHAPIVRRILELADLERGERVLDLGCGTGILAFEASKMVGKSGRVLGIDLAPGMVELALSKMGEKGASNLEFRQMDCRFLSLPESAFDAALACLGIPSLGHGRCFGEVYRVLSPGGRFVFSEWAGKETPLGRTFKEVLAEHRATDPPEALRKLLEARQCLRETGETAAFRDPESVMAKLRALGFVHVEWEAGTCRMVFPNLEAYSLI